MFYHRNYNHRTTVTRGVGHTDEILLVGLVEELLQQPGPEFIEHFFQVDVGTSIVVP